MKSLRDLFDKLSREVGTGEARDALRKFNSAPRIEGKAASVRELAEKLGFSVVRITLPKGVAGRLVQDPFSENGYCIEVNKAQSIQSQRWTVLHEIGHYFLHANHRDPLADSLFLDRSERAFYVDPDEEREANEFAATVLFADGALRAASSICRNDLKKLAGHFGVSINVVQIALRQL